jgi:hypothetical protein
VLVDRGTVNLKAVITITTDLGETFYPDATELVATLQSPAEDGDIYLRRRLPWKPGSRNIPLILNISYQDVEWPALIHVAVNSRSKPTSGFMHPIIDIWSSPLNPTKGHFNSGTLVTRRFQSISSERDLVLYEETGDSIARHLWDGSQALAHHIDQMISLQNPSSASPHHNEPPLLENVLISATYRRLSVLELGCGLGTVGISLAQSIPDCDVLLTDLSSVEDLVKANITAMRPAISSRVTFAPLDWEDQTLPPQIITRIHDLIVVSECTYNTSTIPALVSTLVLLLNRSPKAVILVATKRRHESETVFFELMREAGMVLDGSELRVRLSGIPGTGYGDSASDVGVFCFKGKGTRASISPTGSEGTVPTTRTTSKMRRAEGT